MTKGTLPFVYFRKQIVPAADACVSIASYSLQYGGTCFGGIRCYVRNGRAFAFRLADHYERLMNSSKIMGMGYCIPYEEFRGAISSLIKKNKPKTDFYIRPFIFCEELSLPPRFNGLTFDLAIYFVELGHYYAPEKGLKLGISSWQKFSDNTLPTKAKAGGCYVNSSLATADALRSGYDEALMTDRNGYIIEASVANLLMVYRDRVYSPPIGAPMLEGMTLRTMLDLLKDEGISVLFEPIDRSMIYTCQELMLLGTAAQVSFAESVDGRSIAKKAGPEASVGPGPVCRLLRERFAQVLDNKHARSSDWLTEFSL